MVKPIPQLLKLEIFNPEEDDDSDNSCVSSPDSIDSVNSIKASGRGPANCDKFNFPDANGTGKVPKRLWGANEAEVVLLPGKSMSLLEAAANVASSLDEAVEKVISSRPKKKLPKVDVFSILHRR